MKNTLQDTKEAKPQTEQRELVNSIAKFYVNSWFSTSIPYISKKDVNTYNILDTSYSISVEKIGADSEQKKEQEIYMKYQHKGIAIILLFALLLVVSILLAIHFPIFAIGECFILLVVALIYI